ncbi:MAG: hypothetical protein J2P25_08030 [Nocardiopsaceae bacterium]|nr:hypothetical protein [Nocardiopsaceae bacterium]
MSTGDKQVAALRALLTGDFDRHKHMIELLDKDEDRGYLALVSAAFIEIADRTFGSADGNAAVVEWVGKIRSQSTDAADGFDPVLSEQVILYALGKTEAEDLNSQQILEAELLLLPALVHDQGLDEAGIDEFLSAARALAQP